MTAKTILLIDDETSVRELVHTCLSDLAGWNVITAASAQEGLKQLAIEHLDAILLDVLMPGMNAFIFLQRLRDNPTTTLIPVILLTVKARWFTPQKLQQLGVVEAIAKPFNPVTLPDVISHALQWDTRLGNETIS